MFVQSLETETYGVTHPGMVRAVNEDGLLCEQGGSVFAVADGVGGHDRGDLASKAIISQLATIGVPASARDLKARFDDRMVIANRSIREASARLNGATIGSTVAALLTFGEYYACAWAGDSRIYLLRGGLFQLSRDHSEVQDFVERGLLTPEEARRSPRRNVITRAVGISDDLDLETRGGQIEAGDKFLLCSDGLTGHVTDNEIAEILAAQDARNACDALIGLTLERGASDNVTVVIVAFHPIRRPGADASCSAGQSRAGGLDV